jgi:hypothetical protein
VVDEVAVDSGDHTTYALAHQSVIDVYHGKVTCEDEIIDVNGNRMYVGVEVNDMPSVEKDPHTLQGDFTVNYAAGTLTFTQALQPSDVVKVTYHYARSSKMYIRPLPGKKLGMTAVKVQFSKNVQINDTVIYEVWGQPGTPAPIIMSRIVYKTFGNFMDDANFVGETMPQIGGSSWRGTSDAICTLQWDYKALIPLYSSYNMELRIFLEHDVPYTGTCYATFFCLSQDE